MVHVDPMTREIHGSYVHLLFLGNVPLDPQLCKAAEEGRSCFIDKKCQLSAPALKIMIEKLIEKNGFSSMLVDSA